MKERAVLLLLVLACYVPGFPAPPVCDDVTAVLANPRLSDPVLLARAFVDPTPPVLQGNPMPGYVYRPLTEASFAAVRLLGGGIRLQRVVNWALHVGVVLLVLGLARRLGLPAFWAAAFVAVHPLGVEAVTYVYQRSVLLEAFLVLLCLSLYWASRSDPSPWRSARWWGAFLAGFLSMGAKEPAATLPVSLAALEWVLREGAWDRRKALARWLPFAALPIIVLVQVLRAAALEKGAGGSLVLFREPYSPLQYLFLEMPVVLGYFRMGFLPFPLHFYHDRSMLAHGPGPVIPVAATVLAGAALLAAGAWILLGSVRHRLPRLGLALFLAPLLLESTVFPIRDHAFHHRCYPGLAGLALLFALATLRWRILPILLVFFLLGTVHENRVWTHPEGLMRRDVRHAFHIGAVWGDYASKRLERHDAPVAERISRQGLRIPWFSATSRVMHVRALRALGRREEAHRELSGLLREYPEHPAFLQLALENAEATGDLAGRVAALPRPPPDLLFRSVRGLTDSGRWEEAERLLRRQEGNLSRSALFWDHMGQVLLGQKRDADAEAAYRKAVALEPNLPKARNNLGLILYRRGDLSGAAWEFEEALRLKPDYDLAQRNLEAVRRRKGP